MDVPEFTDSTFNKSSSGQCLLSLALDTGSLSCLVTDSDKKRHLVLRHHSLDPSYDDSELARKLKRLFDTDTLLSESFRKVKCIWNSRKYTTVPESFFDTASIKPLFALAHPVDELDELHFNSLDELGIKMLFPVPRYIGNTINERFHTAQFFNQNVPFLRACIKDARWLSQFVLYVSINGSFADIALFHHEKLILLNSFSIQAPDDLLYFLLAVCKQHSINPGTLHLRIAGDCEHFMELLKTHFPYADYLEPDSLFMPASIPASGKFHRYLNLMNLHLCE